MLSSEFIHEVRVFLWMQCAGAGCLEQEGTNSLKLGWVCIRLLYVRTWSRCSVKRMKNGQEYCSVLRVQFSMNQKQLSWLPFHVLPSARKWDFFHIFLQVKSLQNGIKWGIFFPHRMLKCWKFGADSLETEESWVFGDSRGGLPYICPSPKNPFWTPCRIESWLLVKYWALY